MARPKNPRTIYPGSHHQPTNRYFYYNSVTLFPSHHSHSLFSTLLSNSLKTPRKPTLFSHHANIVLLFLFLLLFTFSFLAFPKIPFLLTSPNSIVRRASATSPLDSTVAPLPAHDITGNLTQEEREFWEQPDGQGYQPCIEFSLAYRQASARITRERRRFVVAVVSGGLNQQRNQIVDVVVIARILESSMQVAFHALRFTAPIRELGDKLARRMWAGGSYVAVHLRLEKDVWIRTRCLPGLGPEYDQLVMDERRSHPELLTGQLNLTHNRRRLAGLCPLNASEVAALLRALGAPRSARVYWAGGEPLGGEQALRPLMTEFPQLMSKEMLASDGELVRFANRSSVLAALDFMVAMSSDVFMPSHGGNMARVMQGHRAYVGHKKAIRPNKRVVIQLLEKAAAAAKPEGELRSMMKRVHAQQLGQPEERRRKKGRDVIAFPVPECMCRRRRRRRRFFF